MNDESHPKVAHESATTDTSVTAGIGSRQEARSRAVGYAVVVHNGDRWQRRIYLSLHSATQAVDRARARGAKPYMQLVELVPVGEVLNR